MKRIISVVLCLVLAVTMFASCGNQSKNTGVPADRTLTMDEIINDPSVVMGKVGEENVYAYELIYLMALGYDVDSAFEEISVLKVMKQKAAAVGVSLTAEEVESYNAELEASVAQFGGKEAFEEMLGMYGLTYDRYKTIMELSYIAQKLQSKATELNLFTEATDAEAKAYFDGNFIKAKHILFATMDSQTSTPLSEEEAAAKLTLATDTLNKIKGGADFDSFASLSEDPGSAQMPDGYVFAVTNKIADTNELMALQQSGYAMVPEFETAANALAVGAVSELVPTDYGYHIIKRVEMTPADYEANKDIILNIVNYSKYSKVIDQWKTEYTSVRNEQMLASINIDEFNRIMQERAAAKAQQNQTTAPAEGETAQQ